MGDDQASRKVLRGDSSIQLKNVSSPGGSHEGQTHSQEQHGIGERPNLQQHQQYQQQQQQRQQYQYQYQQYQQQQQQYHGDPQQSYQQQPQSNVQQGYFDMSSIAHTLPLADYRQQQYSISTQRLSHAASLPVTPTHVPASALPYVPNQMGGQPYYMVQSPQMHTSQFFGGGPVPRIHQPGPVMAQQHGLAFYPGQVQPVAQYHYTQHSQYPSPMKAQSRTASQPIVVSSNAPYIQRAGQIQQQKVQGGGKASSVVRGPPRKPKQSGHAIWIGNLPPQTRLMDLVEHVCKYTDDLESLFLISKSNCAFANYKDEQSCLEAQQKINDTRFMSVRLVSRLRKNVVEIPHGVTPPTGPASLIHELQHSREQRQSQQKQSDESTPTIRIGDADGDVREEQDEEQNGEEGSSAEETRDDSKQASSSDLVTPGSTDTTASSSYVSNAETADGQDASSPSTRPKDRFFILKSLTVEDLESSVRTGIWATQSHNEETLNNAFKSCDNVYLIFSANKSGEYFGYAKMASEINNDPAAAIEFAPKAHSYSEEDLPKAIPTEATEFAPPGRIIDDSARGTIFWEAQRDSAIEAAAAAASGAEDSSMTANDGADEASSVKSLGLTDGGGESQTWGKPFKLEWLSTSKLPFYRTRGMRNPLNANRDIKIARDGTEVDPAVGQRLIGLFHQPLVVSGASGRGSTASVYSAAP